MALILSLVAALGWGAADYAGGVAARQAPALLVTLVSAALGVVLYGASLLVVPAEWSPSALGWGALSGLASMGAAVALYAALAIGPMPVVAPLTATISGVVPVVWAVASGASLGPLTWAGVAIVLVGAAVLSAGAEDEAVDGSPPVRTPQLRLRAVALAIGAGLAFGAFYILLSIVPAESGTVPLLANRVAGLGALIAVFLAVRRRQGMRLSSLRPVLVLAITTGALDALANTLYVFAVREGELAVVAVVVSLYPAATVALAAILLGERMTRLKWLGAGLAFVGVALLAL